MNDQSEFLTCSAASEAFPQPQRLPTLWPTPSSGKITESGELTFAAGCTKPHSATTGNPVQTALTDAVKMWPTPCTRDHHPNGEAEGSKADLGNIVLHHLPTPRSNHSPAPSTTATFPIASALEESRMLAVIRSLSDAVFFRMSSAEDFLASRTVVQGSGSPAQTSATSGANVGGFLGTFDPASRCSKTSAACLQASQDFFSTAYCQTWPRFGTLVNGKLYQQQPLVPLTAATESGCSAGMSWPTATKRDYKGARTPEALEAAGRTVTNTLEDMIQAYSGQPYPAAGLADRESRSKDGSRLELWATPQASDPAHAGPNQRDSSGRPALPAQVGLWATPRKSDVAAAMTMENCIARVEKTGYHGNIEEQVSMEHRSGKLNPHWVFCLMGYPPLWAELGRKFTTASRNSKRQATP
jgi:hypothetical protein